MEYQVILASASPRRRQLLEQVGIPFLVLPCDREESMGVAGPKETVEGLSRQKAEAVAEQVDKRKAPLLVLGADTVVACEDKILGKPGSVEQARSMLAQLQGRSHQVYTGVTLFWLPSPAGDWESESFAEVTQVSFYPMSLEEIDDYIKTGEPMDKAGAYGIQGRCAGYIKGIYGDYSNVVGLPLGRLCQWLREKGMRRFRDEKSGDF